AGRDRGEQGVEARALGVEGGLRSGRDLALIDLVLAERIEHAVAAHELVVQVGGEGPPRVPALGDDLAALEALAGLRSGRQRVEVQEDGRTALPTPLLELDAVAVRAEVPVPARHHAVEGGLHGTAG